MGVSKDASQDDIKKAYRKLALLYHPDKNAGDPSMFVKIQNSYQILCDPSKRMEYDCSQKSEFATSELLTRFFKFVMRIVTAEKPPQKNTVEIHVPVKVTLEDLYRGRVKKLMIKVKHGGLFISKPFYISLLNYKYSYVFLSQGDTNSDGVTGDLILDLNICDHKSGMKIDQVLCSYDLYVDKEISLYEYYYGIESSIEHINGKILTYKKTFLDGSMSLIFRGVGLPCYDEETEIVKRGDVYVFFKLVHKPHLEIPLEDIEFKRFMRLL